MFSKNHEVRWKWLDFNNYQKSTIQANQRVQYHLQVIDSTKCSLILALRITTATILFKQNNLMDKKYMNKKIT